MARTITTKQRKTAELMVDNGGNTPVMTKGSILAQVGYSKAVQKVPSKVFESEGYKQSIQDLLKEQGIDKASRLKKLGEIFYSEDKRSSIEANKEITKMVGEYEQVQRIQDIESDQDSWMSRLKEI